MIERFAFKERASRSRSSARRVSTCMLYLRPGHPHARRRLCSWDFLVFVGLNDVAFFEILEVGEANAAFEASGNFWNIILEASKGLDGALPDDGSFSKEPDTGTTSDFAASDHAASDRTELGNTGTPREPRLHR